MDLNCIKHLDRIEACRQIERLKNLPAGTVIELGYCDKSRALLSVSRYDDNYVEFVHRNANGTKYFYRIPFNWYIDNAYSLLNQVLAIVDTQSSCQDVYDTPNEPAICRIKEQTNNS